MWLLKEQDVKSRLRLSPQSGKDLWLNVKREAGRVIRGGLKTFNVFCNHRCIRNHDFNMDLKHVTYLRPNLILGNNNRKLQEANSSDEEVLGGMAMLFFTKCWPSGASKHYRSSYQHLLCTTLQMSKRTTSMVCVVLLTSLFSKTVNAFRAELLIALWVVTLDTTNYPADDPGHKVEMIRAC